MEDSYKGMEDSRVGVHDMKFSKNQLRGFFKCLSNLDLTLKGGIY